MALSNKVKDLILGIMGGEPSNQQEIVSGLEGGQGSVQANGSVPFTAPQGGVAPVASSDLATKAYVDGSPAGTVTQVTASAPLASSGGVTPNISFTGTLAIANGGTGQTTAPNAINSLLPTQTAHNGQFLTTNGSVSSWAPVTAGANTSLSNLTSPTSLNQDLVPASSNTFNLGGSAGIMWDRGFINDLYDNNPTRSISVQQRLLVDSANNTMLTWGGNITISRDLVINNIGSGVQIKTGSNARLGTSVLVGGAVTVSNTSITANSRIFVTSQSDGGTPGFLRITAKTNGTSFVITSSNGADTSTVAWFIVESVP